jgi:hypothetical protein
MYNILKQNNSLIIIIRKKKTYIFLNYNSIVNVFSNYQLCQYPPKSNKKTKMTINLIKKIKLKKI